MPRPRFERLEPERRRRLLAAAAEEFAAHGFSGASLGRLSAAAGFSKAALYYYFEDKPDLYAGVVEEAWRAILPEERLELASLTRASFWPELRRLYLEMLARSQAEAWLPAAGRLFYDPAPAPGVGAVVEGLYGRARGFLVELIEQGRRLGCVRRDLPPGLLQELLMALAQTADRWMVEHWDELDPGTVDATALRIFDLLAALLRGEGER